MVNLPHFPHYKKLEFQDRKTIYAFTSKLPPYSDYNFVSLWSYNVKDDILISQLNQNLVVRFKDYMSDKQFYSFIGQNQIKETINMLLIQSKKENIIPKLKLVPEDVILNNPKLNDFFQITEDRDNFDYIFLTEEISKLKGSKFSKKRNKVNNFLKKNPSVSTRLLDLKDPKTHNAILDLFFVWEKNKKKLKENTNNELIAIKRLIKYAKCLNVFSLGVYDKNNKLIAFSIVEPIPQEHSVIHFVKADSNNGLFEFIYKSTAEELYKKKCIYINREQDLGIPGLRQAKSSWKPIKFLKKYIISPKE